METDVLPSGKENKHILKIILFGSLAEKRVCLEVTPVF